MEFPWDRGIHPTHTAFSMQVHVCRDKDGSLHSRRTVTEQDENIALSLEGSRGMAEGSWALMVEAARAESLLLLLLKMSNDKEFRDKLESGDALSEKEIRQMSDDALQQMTRGLAEVFPKIVDETTRAVRKNLRGE